MMPARMAALPAWQGKKRAVVLMTWIASIFVEGRRPRRPYARGAWGQRGRCPSIFRYRYRYRYRY